MADKTRLKDLPLLGRLCIFSEFFYGLCIGAWSIAFSFHLSANGVDAGRIGVLLCAGYLFTAVASFFAGHMGDRHGFPRVMAFGALMMGGGLFLLAFSRQLVLFYVGHGIYCIGSACLMSMEFNLPLSLIREEHRQYGYNLVLVFYFLGGIAGNFLCGLCLPLFQDQQNPYRYILIICGICYFCLALFRGRMPRQNQGALGGQGTDAADFRMLLSNWKVPSYLLYGFLTFGLLTLSTGLLNMVLRLWHGMPDTTISLVFSINSFAGCLVLILLPSVTRRMALHHIAATALAAQALAFVGMTFLPCGPCVGMIFLRTISCNVLYTSVDSPMLRSIQPQLRGTYAGMRVFSNYVGMSAASILSGWLVELRMFQWLFLICTGVALAQLLSYSLLSRPFLRGSEDKRFQGKGEAIV